MSNEFLEFCPTDTGTNLTDLGDYLVDADRTSGNKPGVARSALNNRALRQANYITSQFAQFLADLTGTDLLDDSTPERLLAQINASLYRLPPVVTKYTSGSGTHNITYVFFITSGNATAAATYTNNGVTYTVSATVASGTRVLMTGNGAPTVSGTLTKASGSGDATLTFHAVRAPIELEVEMVGGGSGGDGTAGGGGGGTGGNTTFGTALLVANGSTRNSVGTASLGTWSGIAVAGGAGSGGSPTAGSGGNAGAGSPFGGAGIGGDNTGFGQAGATNSGAGGGAAGGTGGVGTGRSGCSGAYVRATTNSPLSTYAYAVGAGGSAGSAGGGGQVGGAGAAGVVIVTEKYQ